MSKINNLIQNSNVLAAYELNLLNQLKLILNIRASQARLSSIPTSSFYQFMGSNSEMQRDIEDEKIILKSLTDKLSELMERSVEVC